MPVHTMMKKISLKQGLNFSSWYENITNLLGPEIAVPQTLLSLASCKLHSLQSQTSVFYLVREWELTQTVPFKLIAQLLLVKGAATLCTCRKQSDEYDLTAAQCFWFAHHNDWSRWFAIGSLPPICYLSFSFMGGVAKKYITILGCEKHLCTITYWALLEML
jgi:hypothetical protein